MTNRFDFYKDLYFKELEKVNEINNSLATPIGLITAIIAGCTYLLTSFDYSYSDVNTTFFISFFSICIAFLTISIYHLIKAYSDFPNGYKYNIIADANDIDKYFLELKAYYKNNPQFTDTAACEVEEYVLKEIINNTGTNQKNNKRKNKFRYNCEYYLIASFITLFVTLIPFIINYANKSKKDNLIKVRLVDILNKSRNFNDVNCNYINMSNNTNNPKPIPPPSQVIKEGQDPIVKK